MPRPHFHFNEFQLEGKTLLEISVLHQLQGPYFYQGKAYQRQDTSTLVVDHSKLTKLVLTHQQRSFDKLEIEGELTFKILEERLKKTLGIASLTKEVLMTLGLYKRDTFNKAAQLLSDNPQLDSSYVDIAVFGESISLIIDRKISQNNSLLQLFDDTMEMFSRHFHPLESVQGTYRVPQDRVPEIAFREAIANALVHRDYTMNYGIQVMMFPNRIEILSPGGLPFEMTPQLFMQGMTSVPRNSILAYVFLRLGLIERLGTGVRRMMEVYKPHHMTPSFVFNSTQVKVILPVITYDYRKLKEDNAIIEYLKAFPSASRGEIEEVIGIDKSKAIRLLNRLIENHYVKKEGEGPSTVYKVK